MRRPQTRTDRDMSDRGHHDHVEGSANHVVGGPTTSSFAPVKQLFPLSFQIPICLV